MRARAVRLPGTLSLPPLPRHPLPSMDFEEPPPRGQGADVRKSRRFVLVLVFSVPSPSRLCPVSVPVPSPSPSVSDTIFHSAAAPKTRPDGRPRLPPSLIVGLPCSAFVCAQGRPPVFARHEKRMAVNSPPVKAPET